MRRYSGIAIALLLIAGCGSDGASLESERKATAERFLRGLYGGDLSIVDELAADDIVISYPAFQEILGTSAVRGLDATREFSRRFSRRWVDAEITVHEAIADGDWVVLVWSFRARPAGASESDAPGDPGEASWGGITAYRFDATGKIALELGEESTPGPHARVSRATPEENP